MNGSKTLPNSRGASAPLAHRISASPGILITQAFTCLEFREELVCPAHAGVEVDEHHDVHASYNRGRPHRVVLDEDVHSHIDVHHEAD